MAAGTALQRPTKPKEDGDESAYAENRWNFGLIDALKAKMIPD